jgi:hypothetical protein
MKKVLFIIEVVVVIGNIVLGVNKLIWMMNKKNENVKIVL